MIQAKTHVEIDVKDFVLGELVVMLMNKFTRTKNKVISKPILPGTTSGLMKKEKADKMVNDPVGT